MIHTRKYICSISHLRPPHIEFASPLIEQVLQPTGGAHYDLNAFPQAINLEQSGIMEFEPQASLVPECTCDCKKGYHTRNIGSQRCGLMRKPVHTSHLLLLPHTAIYANAVDATL